MTALSDGSKVMQVYHFAGYQEVRECTRIRLPFQVKACETQAGGYLTGCLIYCLAAFMSDAFSYRIRETFYYDPKL